MVQGILIVMLGIMAYMDWKQGWLYAWVVVMYVFFSAIGGWMLGNSGAHLIMGVIPAIFLWILAVISKERWIGRADGSVFLGLGFLYGEKSIVIMWIASILSMVVMLIKKRKNGPMIPWIFAATLIREVCMGLV